MKNNIAAFFKAFTYAAKGICHAVTHERNMRFHLCAAVTVIILSLFYDFTRTEYWLLFLCIGSVISSELVNTAVESAVDLTADGKFSDRAKNAKDCAAGAVLVSAVFAAVCGISLFWDISVFKRIILWFSDNLWAAFIAVIWFAAAFAFVFAFNGKKSNA